MRERTNKCLECGKDVKNKYCNISCRNRYLWKSEEYRNKTIKWMKTTRKGRQNSFYDRKHTIESKQKASKTLSDGRMAGINNPMYNKKHSEKAREKMSNTRIRKGSSKGSNNPRFIDGRSLFKNSLYNEELYKTWRNKVFVRDNYTCTKCLKKKKELEAHHKKSRSEFPELTYDLDNGVTLCVLCHRKTFKEINKEIRKRKKDQGFIGFDLDGTLAEYFEWGDGKIGKPIERNVSLLRYLIKNRYNVKIFTARVCQDNSQIPEIHRWLEENNLPKLEITATKDYKMSYMIDDRAIQVVRNTGLTLVEFFEEKSQQLRGDIECHKINA